MTQALTTPDELNCANCGTPLQGEFCHVCGQSLHSVLKPMHGMFGDTLDLLFNVDGRVVHTLPALLLRPGFLTLEYFAGRRMRYLGPFRLMFALCLLAFFVLPLAIDGGSVQFESDVKGNGSIFQHADTPAEVDHQLQKKLAQLAPTRDIPVVGSLADDALDKARLELVREAAQRRIELGDKTAVVPDTMADGPKAVAQTHPPADWQQRNPFDQHWNPQKYPFKVSWLPDFLNQRVNRSISHMHDNLAALSGPGDHSAVKERLVGQIFATLPGAMFFMLPVFALLLKVVYLFKRRLYVEHLIVAIHSHAFLFLSLLLGTLVHLAGIALKPHLPWMTGPLQLLTVALCVWAPIYLLIMQKRVYRQGWPMTVLKYLFVGWCYIWLLAIAVAGAGVLSLAE